MGRLIDADALKDYIVIHNVGCGCSEDYQKSFLESIDDQPTIDSVRKGHWIDKGCGEYRCSSCRELVELEDELIMNIKRFNYCPNCGADMRGEQE